MLMGLKSLVCIPLLGQTCHPLSLIRRCIYSKLNQNLANLSRPIFFGQPLTRLLVGIRQFFALKRSTMTSNEKTGFRWLQRQLLSPSILQLDPPPNTSQSFVYRISLSFSHTSTAKHGHLIVLLPCLSKEPHSNLTASRSSTGLNSKEPLVCQIEQ